MLYFAMLIKVDHVLFTRETTSKATQNDFIYEDRQAGICHGPLGTKVLKQCVCLREAHLVVCKKNTPQPIRLREAGGLRREHETNAQNDEPPSLVM